MDFPDPSDTQNTHLKPMLLHESPFLLQCNEFTQIFPTCSGAFLRYDTWFCRIDILLKHGPSVVPMRSQRIDDYDNIHISRTEGTKNATANGFEVAGVLSTNTIQHVSSNVL